MKKHQKEGNNKELEAKIRATISEDANQLYDLILPYGPSCIYSEISQIEASAQIKLMASIIIAEESLYLASSETIVKYAIISSPTIYIKTGEFKCSNSYIEAENIFIWHKTELLSPMDVEDECVFLGKTYRFDGKVIEESEQHLLIGKFWEWDIYASKDEL